jgi:hypothetical protein
MERIIITAIVLYLLFLAGYLVWERQIKRRRNAARKKGDSLFKSPPKEDIIGESKFTLRHSRPQATTLEASEKPMENDSTFADGSKKTEAETSPAAIPLERLEAAFASPPPTDDDPVDFTFDNSPEPGEETEADYDDDFFLLHYSNRDSLSIETHGLTIKVIDQESGEINLETTNHAGNIRYETVYIPQNAKILLYKDKVKKCELTLAKQNPINDLSYLIHTNRGRERVTIDTTFTDIYTQQIIRNLQERTNAESPALINLSIDPMFSKSMQIELQRYLGTLGENENIKAGMRRGEQFEISLTVMDTRTGEILCAPFATSHQADDNFIYSRRNPNLVRRYIGSSFKPLLSLAAILTYPDLINLNTRTLHNARMLHDNNDGTALLAGFPLRPSFSNEGNYTSFWIGSSGLTEYLSRSDDVYPVVMTTYAMNHKYTNLRNHRQRITNRYNLNGNSDAFMQSGDNTRMLPKNQQGYKTKAEEFMFVKLMDVLYGLNSNVDAVDSLKYLPAYYTWRYLQNGDIDINNDERPSIFSEISPNVTNMMYGTWRNNSLSGELRPWILGQGNNEWSNMKMAEAYARMVGKRDVQISLIRTPEGVVPGKLVESVRQRFDKENDDTFYSSTPDQINNDWNGFLDKFEAAQSNGTLLPPFRNRVTSGLGNNFVSLSKTGTPDVYTRSDIERITHRNVTYDAGCFSFALMTEDQYNIIKNDAIDSPRGIVCVLRIVHSYPHINKTRDANRNIIESKQARDFYTKDRLRQIYEFTKSSFTSPNN